MLCSCYMSSREQVKLQQEVGGLSVYLLTFPPLFFFTAFFSFVLTLGVLERGDEGAGFVWEGAVLKLTDGSFDKSESGTGRGVSTSAIGKVSGNSAT